MTGIVLGTGDKEMNNRPWPQNSQSSKVHNHIPE